MFKISWESTPPHLPWGSRLGRKFGPFPRWIALSRPKKPPTVLKSENGDFRRLISTEIGSSSYFLRLKHLKPGCFCFETLSVVQGKINFNLFSATNSSRQLESSRRFPFGNWQLPLSHFISAMIVSLWTTPDRVAGVSVRYSVRRRLSESAMMIAVHWLRFHEQ